MINNRVSLYVDGERVDLDDKESIIIHKSLKNVRDIANIFADFTHDFKVPASKNNNKLFQHAFRRDSAEFDTRGFFPSVVEVNGAEYSRGYVEVLSGTFSSGDSNTYTVRHYGNLLILSRIIGDTKLSERFIRDQFEKYNFPQVPQIFVDLAKTAPSGDLPFTNTAWDDYSTEKRDAVNDNVRIFLNNDTDQAWKFRSSTDDDDYNDQTFTENETNVAYTTRTTATNSTDNDTYITERDERKGIDFNGIVADRMKASLREEKVLEAIEDAFFLSGLQFSRGLDSGGKPTKNIDDVVAGDEHFFGSEEFLNTWILFYNKQIGGGTGTRSLFFENEWDPGTVYDDSKITYNPFGVNNDGETVQEDWNKDFALISPYYVTANKFSDYYFELDLTVDDTSVPYTLNVLHDNEVVYTSTANDGTLHKGNLSVDDTQTFGSGDHEITFQGKLLVKGEDTPRVGVNVDKVTFEVSSEEPVSISGTITIHKLYRWRKNRYGVGSFSNTIDDADTDASNYTLQTNTPDIKVMDYISGLQKTYNLMMTVEKDANNKNIIVAKKYDDFYDDGDVIDLTKYTDTQDYEASRPQYYTEVAFEYKKSNTFQTSEFDNTNDTGYGDSRHNVRLENESLAASNEYKVQNPFDMILLNNPGDESEDSDSAEVPVFTYAWLVDNSYQATEIGLFRHYGTNETIGDTGDKLLFKELDNTIIGTGESDLNLMSKFRYNTDDSIAQSLLYNESDAIEIDGSYPSLDDPSLFNTYWKPLIEDLYRKHAKIYNFKARLSQGLIQKLDVDNTILISDNTYRINEMEVDLTNGKAMLELVSLNNPQPQASFKEEYNQGYAVNSIEITSFTASGGKYHESGEDIDFTVSARGGVDDLTYKWYKNDVEISGETDTTYTETSAADGDSFYVVVSDGTFERTSGTITLTIVSAVLSGISVNDASPDAQAGTVTVTVSGGDGTEYTLNVQQIDPSGWISDDEFDSTTGTIPSGGSNTHTLTIPKNITSDTRSVVVRAQNNSLPSDVETVTITQDANDEPIVTLTASDTTPLLNETVTFTTTFTDPESDTVTYQWFVDDVEQTGETASSFSYTQSDEGSHTIKVTITDEADNTDSDSVSVEWIDNTTLTVNFTDNTGAGATLNSTAQFTSTGTPGSTWSSFTRTVTLNSGYVFSGSGVTVTESSDNISASVNNSGNTRTITFSGTHPSSADETTSVTINASTQQDLPNLSVSNVSESTATISRPSGGSSASGSWSVSNGCGGTSPTGTWSMSSSQTSTTVVISTSGNSQPACGSSACNITVTASGSGYDSGSGSHSIAAASKPNVAINYSIPSQNCNCSGTTWNSQTSCIGNPNHNTLDCAGTQYPSSVNTAGTFSNGSQYELTTWNCSHTSGNNYTCSQKSCTSVCSGTNDPDGNGTCPY